MSLFAQIKKDQLEARKSKDGVASSLLTTLIGEAGAVGKKERNGDPTDSEVTATIKKFIKNIDELLTHSPGNFQAISEKAILVRYLPKQLTETEIRHIIQQEKFDFTDKKVTGVVMGFFKTNYEGQYDAKIVSQLIKEFQV
ncbi:MAG TPA: GatB/YqeY domain-containing protein [Methanosarcina sp.]|nr:GatB/YqeY domain-containing protein [Methanosarcina sp.]